MVLGGAGARSVLLAVAVSLVAAPAAWAQAGALDASAVVIGGNLTVAGQRDLDFGLVTQGSAPTVTVAAAGSGRWRVSGTSRAEVRLAFLLPSLLTVDASSMPISFGSTSAGQLGLNLPTFATLFDPAAGATARLRAGLGVLFVWLGGTVTVAPAQPPGLYTGAVTLVVSYTGN